MCTMSKVKNVTFVHKPSMMLLYIAYCHAGLTIHNPYALVLLNAWHGCVSNRKQQLLLMSRWKYVGGSPNAARFSNATIQGVLHLLALMRQGVQVHAGTQPLLIVPAPVFTFADTVLAQRLLCHA